MKNFIFILLIIFLFAIPNDSLASSLRSTTSTGPSLSTQILTKTNTSLSDGVKSYNNGLSEELKNSQLQEQENDTTLKNKYNPPNQYYTPQNNNQEQNQTKEQTQPKWWRENSRFEHWKLD